MVWFAERPNSRRVTLDKNGVPTASEWVFMLNGLADHAAASFLAKTSSPSADGDLPRTGLTLEPIHIDETRPDACLWEVTVQYGQELQPEDEQFTFDTTGGTQHITQAKEHRTDTAPSGATAPNHQGAIGVHEGEVEGCDITVPVLAWTLTKAFPSLTTAYLGVLHRLTGKVNDDDFKGFAAGECLFLGASGNQREDGSWEVTYRFASSPNATNIVISPAITVPAKLGWEYLWVEYETSEQADAGRLVRRPIAAHVERVYDPADLTELGIGA